ncbi:hypothetical protein H310_12383 [Aphanomyces invadans]|uniref:Uncharacterized protein n=1 Tax=Aphanomyces invadans TaxID=157072 RepID=A0A024TI42_9STRA|nr:hypothetical protein H310_12383 [Aphanomyces invadans]ETV93820.1 hypothetical protein H310_12383 [Aphanomyces invadans]|eukprot:XP_008877629.1 hypothetical protein H310_12383 [Aphanomyces invadans]
MPSAATGGSTDSFLSSFVSPCGRTSESIASTESSWTTRGSHMEAFAFTPVTSHVDSRALLDASIKFDTSQGAATSTGDSGSIPSTDALVGFGCWTSHASASSLSSWPSRAALSSPSQLNISLSS